MFVMQGYVVLVLPTGSPNVHCIPLVTSFRQMYCEGQSDDYGNRVASNEAYLCGSFVPEVISESSAVLG